MFKLLMKMVASYDKRVWLAFGAMLLTAGLGYWQLCRAAEKKQVEFIFQQSHTKNAIALPAAKKIAPYENIKAKGTYLPLKVLLDNQHYQHQFGYDVIGALLINEQDVLLIDRGFLAAKQSYPTFSIPMYAMTLQGYAYYPSLKQVLLGPVFEKKQNNLFIIEQVSIKFFEKLLHKNVYPFIMRLNKDEEAGFIRDWKLTSFPKERHYAYALQWFLMALGFLIFIIYKQIYRNETKIIV